MTIKQTDMYHKYNVLAHFFVFVYNDERKFVKICNIYAYCCTYVRTLTISHTHVHMHPYEKSYGRMGILKDKARCNTVQSTPHYIVIL